VLQRLNEVLDPCSVAAGRPMGLVEMGMIAKVDISAGGQVDVHLRLTSPACYLIASIESQCVARASACAGVKDVVVHPDEGLDWSPRLMSAEIQLERSQRFEATARTAAVIQPETAADYALK